jgi:DNA-binding response OmpR family regulator
MANANEPRDGVMVVARRPDGLQDVVRRLRDRGWRIVGPFGERDLPTITGSVSCALVDLSEGESELRRALPRVCKMLAPHVVVITALSDSATRIEALRLGVSDHCVAPYDPEEVVARVETLLARRRRALRRGVKVGDLVLRADQRRVFRQGEEVVLTPLEFDILIALVGANGNAVAKSELLKSVWGDDSRNVNAVEAHVSALRRKLDALGPPVIHTVHRRGYAFRPPNAGPVPGSREAFLTERARLLRERDEAVRRRDQLLQELRSQVTSRSDGG